MILNLWLNTGGCVAFIVYGVLINAFPVMLTNALLLLINLYSLLKVYKKKKDFDLLEFRADATLMAKFLGFYEEDMKAYFRLFSLTEGRTTSGLWCCVIL